AGAQEVADRRWSRAVDREGAGGSARRSGVGGEPAQKGHHLLLHPAAGAATRGLTRGLATSRRRRVKCPTRGTLADGGDASEVTSSRIDALPESFFRHLSPRPHAPGDVIGNRYRMVEHLGTGGMGQVFVAENLAIGQKVAVKVLKPELLVDV